MSLVLINIDERTRLTIKPLWVLPPNIVARIEFGSFFNVNKEVWNSCPPTFNFIFSSWHKRTWAIFAFSASYCLCSVIKRCWCWWISLDRVSWALFMLETSSVLARSCLSSSSFNAFNSFIICWWRSIGCLISCFITLVYYFAFLVYKAVSIDAILHRCFAYSLIDQKTLKDPWTKEKREKKKKNKGHKIIYWSTWTQREHNWSCSIEW